MRGKIQFFKPAEFVKAQYTMLMAEDRARPVSASLAGEGAARFRFGHIGVQWLMPDNSQLANNSQSPPRCKSTEQLSLLAGYPSGPAVATFAFFRHQLRTCFNGAGGVIPLISNGGVRPIMVSTTARAATGEPVNPIQGKKLK